MIITKKANVCCFAQFSDLYLRNFMKVLLMQGA